MSPPVLRRRAATHPGRPWPCQKCGTLLGTANGPTLHVKYKDAEYQISGPEYLVVTICRNCGTRNRCSRAPNTP